MPSHVYTYEYDTTYTPSFPVVTVKLNGLMSAVAPMTVSALVDSGSDGTLVPIPLLQQIKAREVGRVMLRGITGMGYQVGVYEVTLEIGGFFLPKLQVVGDKQNQQMILGRNVLNDLIVTLNGLAGVVEIAG